MGRIRAIKNLLVSVYWGNTLATDETLTADAVEVHDPGVAGGVYWTDHFPVNTDARYWRMIGWVGAEWAFIENFDLEPLTGRITLFNGYPIFDSVHLWYSYYINYEFDIPTKDYKTPLAQNPGEPDVFGQTRRTKLNRYPATVDFKWILFNESVRNLLTESMMKNYNFLLLDNNIDETYGLRAFEGGFVSDAQGSIFKGESYLMPMIMEVEQFGIVDLGESGSVGSLAIGHGGAAYTSVALGSNTVTLGEWITITNCTNAGYNGTYKVKYVDPSNDNVDIEIAFGGFTETALWHKHQEIDWSHFNH